MLITYEKGIILKYDSMSQLTVFLKPENATLTVFHVYTSEYRGVKNIC